MPGSTRTLETQNQIAGMGYDTETMQNRDGDEADLPFAPLLELAVLTESVTSETDPPVLHILLGSGATADQQ